VADHPSDETFLDEMAQLKLHLTGEILAIDLFLLTPAERDRLVALARRAPALTWHQMETVTETYGPCWTCCGSGCLSEPLSTAMTRTCSRCSGTGQIVISRTVSTPLHAPAPPEARP